MRKFRVGQIEVGDLVMISTVKRKWRIPKDTKFEIVKIEERDPTVMLGIFEGIKYGIYLEHITRIFKKKEKVSFT
jgi:hypothetical protein